MKKIYKVCIIILVAIVVVVSAIFFLKREKTESIFNDDIKHDLTVSDFKEGDEYQFKGIPWGISQEELEGLIPYSLYQFDEQVGEAFDLYSTEPYLFFTKTTDAIFRFKEDKLTEVQLTFRRDENAVEQVDVKLVFRNEEKIAEEFDPFVAELTELFGAATSRTEDSDSGSIAYTWQTDNTRLQIDLEVLEDSSKDMTLSIGYTEKELDRIAAENVKVSRELPLASFKQDQGYQFGEVAWESSVEEVEALLSGKLKNVTLEAPKEDYVYYDFKDVVYVLNGQEAKASFEFQSDELVYVDFGFYDLEDPKEFFEQIVSVLQDSYGTETDMNQNEKTGYIGYRWRTENSQLAIGFNEGYDEQVTIFLIPLN